MEETNKDKEEQIRQKEQQKAYEQYVKEVTPTHSLWQQMLHAFITGGVICCIGQGILNYAGSLGLDKQTAGSWCSLILVLLSVVLTGFGLFRRSRNGAALVPWCPSRASPTPWRLRLSSTRRRGRCLGLGARFSPSLGR